MIAIAATTALTLSKKRQLQRSPAATGALVGQSRTIVTAARRLNRASGMIAGSVLIDSAMEHYRGNFSNRAMWTPLATAAMTIGASAHGLGDRQHGAHTVRDTIYSTAGAVGLVGTAFHIYNITKQVGGLSWQNLFYAAPLGAPAAITLSGITGFLAERVRHNRPGTPELIFGYPAGQVVAGGTALSLLATSAEAGLLHFRGAFHNPAMLLPVTMPPISAALLLRAALTGSAGRMTTYFVGATAAMGLAGVVFHAYGVSRNKGGFKNWRQTLFAGPPLPAPPSFTGLALAGLSALSLIRRARRG
ncbi:hypothetical protein [Qipengyuania algicida]|uniref:hypothetical protein n=1 Tax=Qipengyuania algicida TaxID=1836209 RepID=UPI001F250135|nr:hypothetical protein [Qipengyuania algicida]